MVDGVARSADQQNIERDLAQAERLVKKGQTDKAIDAFLAILALDPKQRAALMALGKIYESVGQIGKAAECFQHVVDERPGDVFALTRLGKAQLNLGRAPEALKTFNLAITASQDAPSRLYNNLGDALLKVGQPRKAASAFTQALDKGSPSPIGLKRKIESALDLAHDGPLIDIARRIDDAARYSGGPAKDFGKVGRDTLITLLQNGLRPEHKVLDFGCGATRLGYWIIRLLEPGNYYGIEPNIERLEAGKKFALGPDLIKTKAPQFLHHEDCDMSLFGVKFDYVVARSILTHTTPGMLIKMMKSFKANSNPDAVMLGSYWDLNYADSGEIGDELPDTDDRFVRVIKFSLERIQSLAEPLGLSVSEYRVNPIINSQIWLKFEHLGTA